MKRFLCVSLIILYMLVLSSCIGLNQEKTDLVTFYYRTAEIEYGSESGVINSEYRDIQSLSQDSVAIISLYLSGPVSETLCSPFPDGTILLKLNQNETYVEFILSNELAQISGNNLMIACICLARTAMELYNTESVRICVEDAQLNGQDAITITKNSFQMFDAAIGKDPADFTE